MNTVTTIVPAEADGPGAPPEQSSHRGRRLVFVLGLLLVLTLGSAVVAVPYYAISPGSVVDLAGLVKVVDVPSFPPQGTISLTTVSLRPVSALAAVRGWLDPSVDVVERNRVLPPSVDGGDLRAFNLRQMDDSKRQAVAVALERLGYDAVSGSGAEVVQVVPGSPAAGALAAGDVIVGFDGDVVPTHRDLIRFLGRRRPGASVEVAIRSGGAGEERTAAVTLAADPEEAGRAFLGATLRTRDFRFDFPFEVDISSERIGGPSAGLAFTLEVLDLLSEGELTGGQRVAATGTIELDGSVGEVGGVAQKTAAVKGAGIGLFLVPRGELDEATRLAGDRLRVEPVDTLDDALAVLVSQGGDPLPPGPS